MIKERGVKTEGVGLLPIDRKEVEQRVDLFAKRYNLPDSVIARGLATQCFLCKPDEILNLMRADQTAHWETLGASPQEIEQAWKELGDKIEGPIGGLFFLNATGERFVWVTHKRHLSHELNHSLAARSHKDNRAFQSPLFGRTTDPFLGHVLDEIAAEMLELGVVHPNMDIVQVSDSVLGRRKGFLYPRRIKTIKNFLAAVRMTHSSGKVGFTLEDLANHFYNDPAKKHSDRTDNLFKDIRSRVRHRDTRHAIDTLLLRTFFPGAFICRLEDIENYE